MKAVLHYRASPGFIDLLDRARPQGLTIVAVDETDEAAFRAAMRDADVLLHVLRPISAGDIGNAPRLALIQKIGVGVNTIDIEAARARGVAVCNMPGSNSTAVAEMALLLMLGVLRRVAYFDPLTRGGRGWQPDISVFDTVGELAGRTVGLVGLGAIPQRLAPALTVLGARVVYTATAPKTGVPYAFLPLDELLQASDVVSLHCPVTPLTTGLLSRQRLMRMKPGAILVNTARGALVDQPVLVELLRTGRIGGAGLDVFALEPLPAGDPLLSLPNVVVTPHIAWLTRETLARSVAIAVENCRRLADGRELLHRVA